MYVPVTLRRCVTAWSGCAARTADIFDATNQWSSMMAATRPLFARLTTVEIPTDRFGVGQKSLHVPPCLTFSDSTFRPHRVFMCFVWIWEETAIISLYSINWLVFITETECVYCAVRTGSLYTASLTFSNSTFCQQCIYVFCVDLTINSDYFPIQH